MKLEYAGDLTIDGRPRTGIFLSGTRREVSDALRLHMVGDDVEIMGAVDYENWLSGHEEPLATQ